MANKEPKKIIYLRLALRLMAILVLKKYNPKVVSITGSVGKTSAKEAVFTVLASKYRVRRSEKNYNNEIGLPLTIIGVEGGQGSWLGWFSVLLKWFWVMLLPVEYPEILVLEMGADKPGDIAYLVNLVRSDLGIVTEVSLSHSETFGSLEEIAKEKMTLVKNLDEKAVAIINMDNPNILKLKEQIKARVVTFGFAPEADLQAAEIFFNYSEGSEVKGLSFKLNYKGTTLPVRLNNILARHQIYPALAAMAAGLEFGLNLVEISETLLNFSLPFARLNLVAGIKNTALIDDTYNSSPVAVAAALEVLGSVRATRKVAVMGDMLELGAQIETAHRELARQFLAIKGDLFLAVGERMKFAVAELEKNNFPSKNILIFTDPLAAGRKLQEIMREGDLILIKGSQGMRMEKVVEEVMAEPEKAAELLCRQSAEWKSKPFQEK